MAAAAIDFETVTYSAPDGLQLSARIYGHDRIGDATVVCLPGLTRNARDFHELAMFLAGQSGIGRIVAFDYRGRGRSAYDPNWQNYTVPVEAADVIAGAAAFGVERACFIGTSRGGLIIMALAAMQPSLLESVVFNDIGPVIEGDGLAQIRAYLSRTPDFGSLAEAVAFQKSVQGAAFCALEDDDWERMAGALFREEAGRLVPDYDRNLVRTLASIDFNQPLPVLWPQFDGLASIPTMVIRGEHSRLLSQETLDEMARRHPGLEQATVAGQGHAPMLETGDLPERITGFAVRAHQKQS